MACDVDTVLADACTSGIGNVNDELTQLRLIAQLTAEQLVAAVPGTEITPAAILSRACTSGIGKITDQTVLLQLIAQNLCDAA